MRWNLIDTTSSDAQTSYYFTIFDQDTGPSVYNILNSSSLDPSDTVYGRLTSGECQDTL